MGSQTFRGSSTTPGWVRNTCFIYLTISLNRIITLRRILFATGVFSTFVPGVFSTFVPSKLRIIAGNAMRVFYVCSFQATYNCWQRYACFLRLFLPSYV